MIGHEGIFMEMARNYPKVGGRVLQFSRHPRSCDLCNFGNFDL